MRLNMWWMVVQGMSLHWMSSGCSCSAAYARTMSMMPILTAPSWCRPCQSLLIDAALRIVNRKPPSVTAASCAHGIPTSCNVPPLQGAAAVSCPPANGKSGAGKAPSESTEAKRRRCLDSTPINTVVMPRMQLHRHPVTLSNAWHAVACIADINQAQCAAPSRPAGQRPGRAAAGPARAVQPGQHLLYEQRAAGARRTS